MNTRQENARIGRMERELGYRRWGFSELDEATQRKMTMLCVRCGELVPEGTCNCGNKQELRPCGGKSSTLVDLLGQELGRLLSWHDRVRELTPLVPSPNYIDEIRAAYDAWREWTSETAASVRAKGE
jgi:hypothetical protein